MTRRCLREPVDEIFQAALLLEQACAAHNAGDRAEAAHLITLADLAPVKAWGYSLWGKQSPYVRPQAIPGSPPYIPVADRTPLRMPTQAEKKYLLERDGYHCRFCGIPVIRAEVRQRFVAAYPELRIWGRTSDQQHAAFQTLWVQYDHILPHARGGDNHPDNMVIACAPCNFGRMNYTLEEVGLGPLAPPAPRRDWNGLEYFTAQPGPA